MFFRLYPSRYHYSGMFILLSLLVCKGQRSSRAREFHPHPLTEPCVKVSPHTALHTLCFVHMLLSSYPPLCLRVYNSSCLSVSPPSLHAHYRHFSTTTGQSATEEDFGTFLPCSSLSAFPLTFRLLLPTFRQQACITVLPPLCRMPQCHRQVIALLVARTVRH